MKIENIEEAISIVRQIKETKSAIDNFEEEKALNLRIELQFSGGRIGVKEVKKGTPEYFKIVEILTEPLYREIEKLRKEYDKLDKE